jgi:hypothetical protein
MKAVDTNFNYFGGRNICQQQALFFSMLEFNELPSPLTHKKRLENDENKV